MDLVWSVLFTCTVVNSIGVGAPLADLYDI